LVTIMTDDRTVGDLLRRAPVERNEPPREPPPRDFTELSGSVSFRGAYRDGPPPRARGRPLQPAQNFSSFRKPG